MPKALDLTGRRFGRLTALSMQGRVRFPKGSAHRQWLCICECGCKTAVTTGRLQSGMTKSCGCLKDDVLRERATKHGQCYSSEYTTWWNMRKRCSNPLHNRYASYGGRGISICERWQSFETFLADMGPKPSAKYTIERIDNDKGYSPENCVWLLHGLQSRNKTQRADNTSGHTGIAWHKQRQKWIVRVGRRYIGLFADINEAIMVRQTKAAEYGLGPRHGMPPAASTEPTDAA